MALTEEQKKQLRDIIEKQRIFVYEEVVALMGLPKPEVRKEINRMFKWHTSPFKKCPYCGREIIVIDRNCQQIYCSQEHKKLYNSKNRKKTKATICARCGKEFFQYSFRNSKYCSIECAARDREEAKRKKAEKK